LILANLILWVYARLASGQEKSKYMKRSILLMLKVLLSAGSTVNRSWQATAARLETLRLPNISRTNTRRAVSEAECVGSLRTAFVEAAKVLSPRERDGDASLIATVWLDGDRVFAVKNAVEKFA
jgi:hypothetical protein